MLRKATWSAIVIKVEENEKIKYRNIGNSAWLLAVVVMVAVVVLYSAQVCGVAVTVVVVKRKKNKVNNASDTHIVKSIICTISKTKWTKIEKLRYIKKNCIQHLFYVNCFFSLHIEDCAIVLYLIIKLYVLFFLLLFFTAFYFLFFPSLLLYLYSMWLVA